MSRWLRWFLGVSLMGALMLTGCARQPAVPSPSPTPRPPTATPSPSPTVTDTPTVTPTPTFTPTPTPAPVCGRVRSLTVLVVGAYPGLESMADAVRLVVLDFVHPGVRVVPLPRDLRVDLPETSPYKGPVKLTSAYFLGTRNFVRDAPREGGALQLMAVVEQNFGIPVDRYLVVSGSGFARFIDAIGGVPVYLPYPIHDKNTHADFAAGHHWFTGRDALKLARIRMDSNDFVRIQRQSWLLEGVLRSLLQGETLAQLPEIVEALRQMQMTDLTADDLARATCLLGVMMAQGQKPQFFAVPTELLTQQAHGEVYVHARPKTSDAPPEHAFVLLWDQRFVAWLQQALQGEIAGP